MKQPDFVYNSLRISIITWYDEVYQGDATAKLQLHLTLLDNFYDPVRFANTPHLGAERDAFLKELHDLLQESYHE